MAEQDINAYETETPATIMYRFKEAAGDYLQLKNEEHKDDPINKQKENEILERMLGRLPYFFDALASENADAFLKQIAAPYTDVFWELGREKLVFEPWFLKHVSHDTAAEMDVLKNEQQKLLKKKEQTQKKLTEVSAEGIKAKDAKEKPEVHMFRAEITALIQKSRKFDDAEKEKMISALQSADFITYQRKDSNMTYRFGDYKVMGQIASAGVIMHNRLGQRIYSGGEAFSQDFAYGLKKSGKIVTAKGQSVKNTQTASAKTKQKIKELEQALQEADNQLKKNLAEQEKCFTHMVKSLDPRFLLREIADTEGVLAQMVKKHHLEDLQQQKLEAVIVQVYNSHLIWQVYKENGDEDTYNKHSLYDKAVEQELYRNGGREEVQSAAQKFFRQFEVLAKKSDGSIDVAKVSDEDVKKIFQGSVSAIKTSLPIEIRKEAIRQEIFRQALTRNGGSGFCQEHYEMMNRVLMMEGMRIELQPVLIKEKMNTASARDFSNAILENMREGNNLQQKHKTEALLYYLGKFRAQYKDENLKDTEKNPVLSALFCEFSEVFYGKTTSNLQMKPLWNEFVADLHNLRQADQMYLMFNKMRVPGVNVEKLIQKLASGRGINDKNSLVVQSKHHLLYRRFAGFFGSDIDELNKMFNASERIIDTISLHPAFQDVHRDKEHRFDMGEEYLYQKKDGQIVFGAYSRGNVDDKLVMPVVCVKNDKGAYEPLMKEGMLLMTSSGVVLEPHVPGKIQPENVNRKETQQSSAGFVKDTSLGH